VKISRREILVGIITLFVLLFGVTYWIGGAQVDEYRQMTEDKERLLRQIQLHKRILEEQERWSNRLAELQAELPVYKTGISVSGNIMRSIRSIAAETGLEFIRSGSNSERQAGTLYEINVSCDWRGELDELIRFLYELNKQGLRFDVRELSVRPNAKQPEILNGDMTIACAYRRSDEPETEN